MMAEPTLIPDLPEVDYHADPCDSPSLSSSIANLLLSKSPAHAWMAHPKLGGQPYEPTSDMDEGSLIHALLLKREQQICVVDADDFKTKAARELRDEARANGQVPVIRHKYDAALYAAGELYKAIGAHGFNLIEGMNEATFLWEEPSTLGSVKCRARLDHVEVDRALIIDLKKSRSAHPRACEKHVIEYGYDLQRAAYVRAVEKKFPDLIGRIRYVLLFVEMQAPFAVTPAEMGGVLRERGERRWDEAVGTWAQCLDTGKWPSYTDGVVQLQAPPWVLRGDAA